MMPTPWLLKASVGAPGPSGVMPGGLLKSEPVVKSASMFTKQLIEEICKWKMKLRLGVPPEWKLL